MSRRLTIGRSVRLALTFLEGADLGIFTPSCRQRGVNMLVGAHREAGTFNLWDYTHPVDYSDAIRTHARVWHNLGYHDLAWGALSRLEEIDDPPEHRAETRFLAAAIARAAGPANRTYEYLLRQDAHKLWQQKGVFGVVRFAGRHQAANAARLESEDMLRVAEEQQELLA